MSAGSDRGPLGAEPGQGPVARPASRLIGAEPEGVKTGLSTGVLRVALQEAMHARLEAFQAGERIYDELLKEAEARSGQILSEAQAEADRIVANARVEAERTLVDAVQQAKALHDETTRQVWETGIALAEMRSQRSTLVRRLWGRLTGRSEDAADLPMELPIAAPVTPTPPATPSLDENARTSGAPAPSLAQTAPSFAETGPSLAEAGPPTAETAPPSTPMAQPVVPASSTVLDRQVMPATEPSPFVAIYPPPAVGAEAPGPVQEDEGTSLEKTAPAQGEKAIDSSETGPTVPPKGSWVIPDWLK